MVSTVNTQKMAREPAGRAVRLSRVLGTVFPVNPLYHINNNKYNPFWPIFIVLIIIFGI